MQSISYSILCIELLMQKQQRRKKAGLATDSEIQVNDTTYQEWLKSETELTITRATKQAQATPIKELMQQPLLVNNAGEEIGMELNVQEPASRNRSNESSRHASSRASPAQQQHQQQEAEENAGARRMFRDDLPYGFSLPQHLHCTSSTSRRGCSATSTTTA